MKHMGSMFAPASPGARPLWAFHHGFSEVKVLRPPRSHAFTELTCSSQVDLSHRMSFAAGFSISRLDARILGSCRVVFSLAASAYLAKQCPKLQ